MGLNIFFLTRLVSLRGKKKKVREEVLVELPAWRRTVATVATESYCQEVYFDSVELLSTTPKSKPKERSIVKKKKKSGIESALSMRLTPIYVYAWIAMRSLQFILFLGKKEEKKKEATGTRGMFHGVSE